MEEDLQILNKEKIKEVSNDNYVNLVINTLNKNKQILVFNASKSSSQKSARVIVDFLKKNPSLVTNKKELELISNQIFNSLETPTKQCLELSELIKYGIAFHNSGITTKQRSIIEKNFKLGIIKVISATPTLAAGLNLPTYKVIIKDYKRYSKRGYQDIPVLEYNQMSGRAGRSGYEESGVCVIISKEGKDLEKLIDKYIYGENEEIYSKLSSDPILKTYLLALIASDIINTKKEILEFFENTLYAKQYDDLDILEENIFRILKILIRYKFLIKEDEYYIATELGKKVSHLYVNPDTAYYYMENLEKFINKIKTYEINNDSLISFFCFITNILEFKPPLNVLKNKQSEYFEKLKKLENVLDVPFHYNQDLYEQMGILKLSNIYIDYINEKSEDYLFKEYNISPGELKYKLDRIDWIFYVLENLCDFYYNLFFKTFIKSLRNRMKYGVKSELLNLTDIDFVGRKRARKLYENNIKNFIDLKNADKDLVISILGEKITDKIFFNIDNVTNEMKYKNNLPKELRIKEVNQDEIDTLILNDKMFEQEKENNINDLRNFLD